MRRWVPPTVVLLTCALLAGSVYAAERVGLPAPDRGAAAAYLPEDGFAAHVTEDRGDGRTRTQVVESARGNGLTLVQGLTFVFGALMLQSLVELPADVAPGATWTGRGEVLTGVMAETTLTYTSTFRAEAADGGCLRVSGEVAYAGAAGTPGETERHRKLWCPGRGMVEAELVARTGTVTTRPVAPPPPPERATVRPPVRWTDPAGWTVRTFRVGTVDPNFGDYPQMVGAPTLVPPVVTASGDLYRVTQAGDLVGSTPHTGDLWRSTARMHPGGVVLTVSSFGEVFVVTTSRRQAVGYTADGIRLWTLDLPEIVKIAADRASTTEAVLCDIAGGLRRVDLRTGVVRWQRDVGHGVELPPVVAGGRLVVNDTGSRQTAYDLETGEQIWRTERSAAATAYAGGVLYAVDREALEAIDPADGSLRWRRVADGTLAQLATVDDRAVVATGLGTTIVGPDGTEVARLTPYAELTVAPGYVVGWTKTTAEAWTADGRRRAGWTPSGELFSQALAQPVAEPAGLRLPYLDWRLDTWSAAHE